MEESEDFIAQRRDRERGRSVTEVLGYPRDVVVMRAQLGDSDRIGAMAYVYMSPSPLTPGAFERARKAIEDGEPLRRREDKLLKMTLEHAITTALYHGEKVQVVVGRASSNDVYEATNPGEYFLDGKQPLKAVVVASVDEMGQMQTPDDPGADPRPSP